MPKTTAEKIATKREQIQQLKNEEKQLIQKQKQQDRKDRTKRLWRCVFMLIPQLWRKLRGI